MIIKQGVPSGRRLGLVDLDFDSSPVCPNSASVGENLAEVACQLGKLVERSIQSPPNPGLWPGGTQCTVSTVYSDTERSLFLTVTLFQIPNDVTVKDSVCIIVTFAEERASSSASAFRREFLPHNRNSSASFEWRNQPVWQKPTASTRLEYTKIMNILSSPNYHR